MTFALTNYLNRLIHLNIELMKISRLIIVLFIGFSFFQLQAQNVYKALPDDENSILIEGTSNIHDWEIIVEGFTSELDLTQEKNKALSVTSINLTIPVESLKSGKSKMDKNTYKALESDAYALISFKSRTPAFFEEVAPGVYQAEVKGNLSISGTSKAVEIPLKLYKSPEGYTLKAEKELTMLDFDIEPPTALFGTITTGEIVNIKFNLKHYKS